MLNCDKKLRVWDDSTVSRNVLAGIVFSMVQQEIYFQWAKTDDVMCVLECAAGWHSLLSTLRLASHISGDTSHVLHSEHQLMPSGTR